MVAAWRELRGVADELFPSLVATELAEREDTDDGDGQGAYCGRCGASAGEGAATARGCAFCVDRPVPWDRFVRLGEYHAPLSRWIVQMKFQRTWRWCERFGRELAAAPGLQRGEEEGAMVCAVPMHWRRRWLRGYDQAQLIAESLAKAKGWQFAPLLRRTRLSLPQTSVPVSQRGANVRGSFDIEPVDLEGEDVVLVDDVKTTGSTLSPCARLLKRAGAARVTAAVVAVADPRGQEFQTV